MRRRRPPKGARGPKPGRRRRERDPHRPRHLDGGPSAHARGAAEPRRWRVQDTRKLERVVHKLSDDRLAEKHARVRAGGRPGQAHVARALELLWGAAHWEVRREMLADLGAPDDAALLPALTRLVSGRDAMTATVVAEACARVGSPAAMPLLTALLEVDGALGVRVAAARALGAVGTRRALHALSEAAGDRDRALSRAATDAIAAIDARHPADGLPDAGSLSLTELGSAAGALTEALGEDGALELIGEVEAASTSLTLAPDARGEMAGPQGWHALGPAPRLQPVAAAREMVTWGANGLSALGWFAIAVGAISGPVGPTVAACVMVGAALVLMGAWRMRFRWSMLRRGHPGFARPAGHTPPDLDADPPRPNHTYAFSYVTLAGQARRFERSVPVRREAWATDPVAILYLPGDDGAPDDPFADREMLDDELLNTATVEPAGRWVSDPQQMALTAAPAALAFGAWLVRLVL
jgi:hypothetical protein